MAVSVPWAEKVWEPLALVYTNDSTKRQDPLPDLKPKFYMTKLQCLDTKR